MRRAPFPWKHCAREVFKKTRAMQAIASEGAKSAVRSAVFSRSIAPGGLYAGFRSEAAEASPSRRKNAPHGF